MIDLTVDVQIACDDPHLPTEADIQNWVAAAVQQSGQLRDNNAEIAVRIVDAVEIRTLNGLYREQDKATNVLSFPIGKINGLPDDSGAMLGDIVICASVVAVEAEEQGKTHADHWAHMLVHGALHLLGFDHQTDAQAVQMEGLETKILASRNVTDPYAVS